MDNFVLTDTDGDKLIAYVEDGLLWIASTEEVAEVTVNITLTAEQASNLAQHLAKITERKLTYSFKERPLD